MTKADVHFETAATIYAEGEEIPITDILAYFDIDEDIKEGDIVIHRSKHYRVVQVEEVVSINNKINIRCCLEPVS